MKPSFAFRFVLIPSCAAYVLALPSLEAQSTFTTTPNSDYATAANWVVGGVIPGNGNNNGAQIGFNNTASAIYSTATGYTTTSRLLLGLGTGNGTLTMNGSAGTLSFGGSPFNSANYIGVDGGTGTLNANAGTLALTGMAGGGGHLHVGSNAGTSNGTLSLGGGTVNVGTRLTMGVGYPGDLANVVGNNGNGNGTITINSGTLNIGTGAVADTDLGFLYMKSPTGGTGAATVNLNGGTLSLSKFQIGTGGTSKTINFNGGTLKARASRTDFLNTGASTIVQNGGALIDTNGFNVTIGGLLAHDTGLGATPDGGLTKSGTGTLELTAANNYTGSTIVTGGTLHVASSGSLTNISALNTKSGGAMTISGTVTIASNGSLGVGAGVTSTTGSVTLNTGGVLNIGGGGGFTGIGGRDVTGTGLGNGTLTLAGGTLNVAAPGTAAGGPGGLDATNFWMNPYGTGGGTSTVNLDGGVISTLRTFTNGSGSSTVFNLNGGTLQAATGYVGGFFNGLSRVNVRNGGAVIDTNGNNSTVSAALLHSNIGGDNAIDGGLTKTGSGTLTLSAANTYTGPTMVSGGTLAFSGSGTTSTASAITVQNGGTLRFNRNDTWGIHSTSATAPITIQTGGVVQSNNTFNALINLTLAGGTLSANDGVNVGFPTFGLKGTVTSTATSGGSFISTTGAGDNNTVAIGTGVANGTTTFQVANGSAQADLTVSVPLANLAGQPSGLVKTGAGTMVLSATNTYTGATTVDGGEFRVDGSITSNVTINNGGTLSGIGTVTGSMTFGAGSVLAPGNSPGIINHVGALTLNAGSTFLVDVWNPTSDQVNLTGTLAINDATLSTFWGGSNLNIFLGGVPNAQQMVWLVLNDGVDGITGTFLNDGGTVNTGLQGLFGGGTSPYLVNGGGQTFAVFYDANQAGLALSGGNDLLLIAIPEPSRALLLLLSILPFVANRRRSR